MKLLKGLLTVFAVCVILPATTKADVELQGNVGGGLTILSFEAGDESESETGGHFGIGGLGAFSISDDLQFTGGLSFKYHSVSATEEIEVPTGNIDPDTGQPEMETEEFESTFSFMNLSIPIGIRYHITNEFYGHFAIQPGFVLNRSQEVDGEEVDLEDDGFNDFEFSTPLGVGYRMDNGLDLGITYSPLLTNMINTDDLPEGVDEPTQRYHNISLTAGFFF